MGKTPPKTARQAAYAAALGSLTRDDFQEAVCTALRRRYADFQRVPTKPSGDGGIDGLSHDDTRAYFCYGPDPVPPTATAALRQKVIEKFAKDMRRVLELDEPKAGTLKHCSNTALPGIVRPGRIKLIHLVCNTFEDNQVLAPLKVLFDRYKKKSKRNFIAQDCCVTFWGPKDVAAETPVDDLALFTLQQPTWSNALKKASSEAATHQPAQQAVFDDKFQFLEKQASGLGPSQVGAMRNVLRDSWSFAILATEKMNNNLPELHRQLESARAVATFEALSLSGGSAQGAPQTISELQKRLRELLEPVLGESTPPADLLRLCVGEAASLIGRCALDWRGPR